MYTPHRGTGGSGAGGRSTSTFGRTPQFQDCHRVKPDFDRENHHLGDVVSSGTDEEKFTVNFPQCGLSLTTDDLLGKGGFGKVYTARDAQTGDRYALKVGKISDEQAKKRLREEVAILNMLKDHENVIDFKAGGTEGDTAYIVTERCTNQNLGNLCVNPGFTLVEWKFLGYQLVKTIAHMHAMGCIHRDLKPQNLLFDFDGNLKVIDFGLSTRMKGDRQRKTVVGTALFMAPEVVNVMRANEKRRAGEDISVEQARYDEKIDVWSVGVILYAMAARRNPYVAVMKDLKDKGIPKAEMNMHIFDAVVEGKWGWPDAKTIQVPQEIVGFVNSILIKDQKQRPSMQQLLDHPIWNDHVHTAPYSLLTSLRLIERRSESAKRISAVALGGLKTNQHGSPRRLSEKERKLKGLEKMEQVEDEDREVIEEQEEHSFQFFGNLKLLLFAQNEERKALTGNQQTEWMRIRNQLTAKAPKAKRNTQSFALAGPPSPHATSLSDFRGSPSFQQGVRRSVSQRVSSGSGVATEVTHYHCMNKHTMTKLTSIPKGYEGYDCNVCDAALNKLSPTLFVYRCKKCDFDICMGCTHAHKEVDVTFSCDSCQKRFPTEVKRDKHKKTCRGPSIQGTSPDVENTGRDARPTLEYENARVTDTSILEQQLSRTSGGVAAGARKTAQRKTDIASRASTNEIYIGNAVDSVNDFGGFSDEDSAIRNMPAVPLNTGGAIVPPTATAGRKSRGSAAAGGVQERETVRLSTAMAPDVGIKRGRASLLDITDLGDSSAYGVMRPTQEDLEDEGELLEDEPARKRQRLEGRNQQTGDDVPPPADQGHGSLQRPNLRGSGASGGISRPVSGLTGLANNNATPSSSVGAVSSVSGHLQMNLAGADRLQETQKPGRLTRKVSHNQTRQKSMSAVANVPANMVAKPQSQIQPPQSLYPDVYQQGPGSVASGGRTPMSSLGGVTATGGQHDLYHHQAPPPQQQQHMHYQQHQTMVVQANPASPLSDPRGGAPMPHYQQQQGYLPPHQQQYQQQQQHPQQYMMAHQPQQQGARNQFLQQPHGQQFIAPAPPRQLNNQQQLEPRQKPQQAATGRGGFMAAPENPETRKKFNQDFISGSWVRSYSFADCDDVGGDVILFYSVQAGRVGAMFATDTPGVLGTMVLDIASKTALVVSDVNGDRFRNAVSSEPSPYIQTSYDDPLEVASVKNWRAKPKYKKIIEAILSYHEESVRMRADGVPPLATTASYVHHPEQVGVPVATQFVYLRRFYPDPDKHFSFFRLSNLRSQVIWPQAEFDVRWQATVNSTVGLKYYVPKNGEIQPFKKDEHGLMKSVDRVVNANFT